MEVIWLRCSDFGALMTCFKDVSIDVLFLEVM